MGIRVTWGGGEDGVEHGLVERYAKGAIQIMTSKAMRLGWFTNDTHICVFIYLLFIQSKVNVPIGQPFIRATRCIYTDKIGRKIGTIHYSYTPYIICSATSFIVHSYLHIVSPLGLSLQQGIQNSLVGLLSRLVVATDHVVG